MATTTVAADQVAFHGTLTAGVIEVVNFAPTFPSLEVISHGTTAPIWYTLDGTAPVTRGPRCFVIPANFVGGDTRSGAFFEGARTVKLLCTAAADVSIQRV